MTIDNYLFDEIPVDMRVPGNYVQISANPVANGLPMLRRRVLLVAPHDPTVPGTGIVHRVASVAAARELVPTANPILVQMAEAAFKADPGVELYALLNMSPIVGDDVPSPGRVKLAISMVAGRGGKLMLYIGGQRVMIDVPEIQTAGIPATLLEARDNLIAAINARPELGVVATPDDGNGLINIDMKVAGIDTMPSVLTRYYDGDRQGDGITLEIVNRHPGVGLLDVDALQAAIGDSPFSAIALWTCQDITLQALRTWLANRFKATVNNATQVYAFRASAEQFPPTDNTLNSPHICRMRGYNSPTHPWVWAAAMATVCDREAGIDPARPLQTLVLPDVLPAERQYRPTLLERQDQLENGWGDHTGTEDGRVLLSRVITTYATTPAGAEDSTFYDLETVQTAIAMRFSLVTRMQLKYARMKLANDGQEITPGQPTVTPAVLRAEMVAIGRDWEAAGWLEDFEQYKRDVIVVRSAADPNRVNAVLPPNIINGLRVFAANLKVTN